MVIGVRSKYYFFIHFCCLFDILIIDQEMVIQDHDMMMWDLGMMKRDNELGYHNICEGCKANKYKIAWYFASMKS